MCGFLKFQTLWTKTKCHNPIHIFHKNRVCNFSKRGKIIAKSQLEDKLTTYFDLSLYLTLQKFCSPMDISIWILKGQVTVPTEASRSPGEEFEISKDTLDGQGLHVYHVWYYGLRKWDPCQAQDQDVSLCQKWCAFLSQIWHSHHNCTRLFDTKLHEEPCALANLEFETTDSWPLGNSLYVRVDLTNGIHNLWRIHHLYTFS